MLRGVGVVLVWRVPVVPTSAIRWKLFAVLNLTARFCCDTFFPASLPQRGWPLVSNYSATRSRAGDNPEIPSISLSGALDESSSVAACTPRVAAGKHREAIIHFAFARDRSAL